MTINVFDCSVVQPFDIVTREPAAFGYSPTIRPTALGK
jgi:hypothetical protein